MSQTSASGQNRTFLTSAAGVAMSLAGLAAALAPFLAANPKHAALALAVAGVCSSLGALLGNVGSTMAKNQSQEKIQSVASLTAEHVAENGDPIRAAAIAAAPKDGSP